MKLNTGVSDLHVKQHKEKIWNLSGAKQKDFVRARYRFL
jgi:hypothetical protein